MKGIVKRFDGQFEFSILKDEEGSSWHLVNFTEGVVSSSKFDTIEDALRHLMDDRRVYGYEFEEGQKYTKKVTFGSCETCKFAWHHPDPGPEPVNPYVEPTTFWGKLLGGRDIFDDYEFSLIHSSWKNKKENVICKRFPKTAIKLKDSTCGEFKLKSPKIFMEKV